LLGGILLKQHRDVEAEPVLRESLMLYRNIAPDEPRTFQAEAMLGKDLLVQKKYVQAETLLLASYEGLKKREEQNAQHIAEPPLTELIERIVQLYEATGKHEKAEEWRAKLPSSARDLPNDVFAPP
jgi:hypothetical protein